MRHKRARILAVASELFRARGFTAVTTQEISDRAGIATGTLFRYAASKSELLIMTQNEVLSEAIATGARRAAETDDPGAAVFAMVAPIVESAGEWPENTAAYQRELLFGSSDEEFRAVGLAMIDELESEIAVRLTSAARAGDTQATRRAASSVFAIVHLTIARMSTGAHADHDALDDLRAQIEQIVAGLRAGS